METIKSDDKPEVVNLNLKKKRVISRQEQTDYFQDGDPILNKT
jgi:hypothetical protein